MVLENEGFDTTFGPVRRRHIFSQTLTSHGVLLSGYYGTGHASLDEFYIAMISESRQPRDTTHDCQTYKDFTYGEFITPDRRAISSGCTSAPSPIKTITHQLKANRKTWRAYMGDMGNDPNRESATCGHPVLNTTDLTQTAEAHRKRRPAG